MNHKGTNTVSSVRIIDGHFYIHMPDMCSRRDIKDHSGIKIISIEYEVE